MTPTLETRIKRMLECESDLAANGIHLARSGKRAMRLLVRIHLDYFQLMLGYDAAPREVIALAQRLKERHGGGTGRAGRRSTRRCVAL